jgi:hypothetical protein
MGSLRDIRREKDDTPLYETHYCSLCGSDAATYYTDDEGRCLWCETIIEEGYGHKIGFTKKFDEKR